MHVREGVAGRVNVHVRVRVWVRVQVQRSLRLRIIRATGTVCEARAHV